MFRLPYLFQHFFKNMETHRNKTFTLIIWLLCVTGLSLGGFFLYLIISRDMEADALTLEARELVKKDEQLSSVRIALRESSGVLEEIDSVFVREDDIPSFIDSFELLASKHDVSISLGSINVDVVANTPSVKQLRIKASSVGQWDNLMSFVGNIEALTKATLVQKLSLNKDNSSTNAKDDGRQWNATFDISVLILSN